MRKHSFQRNLGNQKTGEITILYTMYFSTSIKVMDIKLGKVLNYYEGLPPIKLNNPLNMCSRELI